MRSSTQQTSKKKPGMYIPLFGGCIVVMLLVALIAIGIRTGAEPDLNTRDAVAAAELTELNSAIAAFDTIGYPNADILGDILPKLELHFHAASVLDELLIEQYGEEYRLIDAEIYRYIMLTMDEIKTAATQGNSTSLGIENMSVYMLLLRDQLALRFDAQGAILPLNG